MATGVARPLEDFEAYRDQLSRFVFRSGFIMKPLFAAGEGRPQARDLCRGRG
jgi:malate dehydrogenase (oxaloacetate-decarboxylating)(NADP+)